MNRKHHIQAGLALLSLLIVMPCFCLADFYVSPSGSDTNNGTSASTPFKTLEKARDAMRASGTVKTTYLMEGTFARTNTLSLTSSDHGESWLAMPGQRPVIDGQNSVGTAISISGGNNITIRWLTIQNFTDNGIIANSASNITIDSNTIRHITSSAWYRGAIRCAGSGSFANSRITHNYISDLGYNGISINATAGQDINNLVIEYNVVYDYMKQISDGGGIYVMDRGHAGVPVRIANNIVGNYGSVQDASKHIYLDDMMSNATVENNICFGACTYAVQYHGGDHNVFRNNIFDITESKLGLYQDCTAVGDYGMAGNSFYNNIVYSGDPAPSPLWTCSKAESDALPSVYSNDYWQANGNTMPNGGSIVDSSPLKIDPNFVDAENHDYRFQSGPPMASFKSIDMSTVGPLPNDNGP